MTIRVLLADDQTLIRSGFRVLVSSAPDLEVVAEASNGREAVELARTERADVVLMDIRMPELDGLAATRHDHRRRGARRGEGADPDHVRGRRVRLRGDPRRSQRVPRQVRRAGRADRRDPDGRPRRRAAFAEGGPRPDQPLPRRTTVGQDLGPSGARRPHRPGARDRRPGRPRAVQRRDRRTPGAVAVDREDPRQPGDDEARVPRPRPARRARLPDRPGPSRDDLPPAEVPQTQ